MCPPKPGSPSYDEFHAQRTGILESLARRAGKVAKGLRDLEGVTCVPSRASLQISTLCLLPGFDMKQKLKCEAVLRGTLAAVVC